VSELDVGATLRALHGAGVDFILTGGVAVAAYGHVRGTEDIDLIPDPDPDNLLRLDNALAALGARRLLGEQEPWGPADHDALAQRRNLSVVTDHGPVDVIQRVPGLDAYRGLAQRAIEVEAFGVPLLVIGKTDLLAAKRSRGEPRDLDDLEALGGA
jgi:predicted nucleotidyltransferase